MTYREYITDTFRLCQAALMEYTALCLKVHESSAINEKMLKECDEKFAEYNHLLCKHHDLLKMVTREKVALDDEVHEFSD